MRGRLVRWLVIGVVGGLAAIAVAAPAGAHVTIQPGDADAGGFATEAFQVPNERDDASTVQLEVEFPTDHPIPFVSVEPVTGWTIDVERTPLDEPGEGGDITEVVSRITWSGGEIAPGQFQTFPVSMGPLPTDTDQLVFKALQTYSSGEVVRWIEEPTGDGSEPEHPAPVLTLTAPTDNSSDDTASDLDNGGDSDDGLAVAALVVGGLGLATGGTALVLARRRAS